MSFSMGIAIILTLLLAMIVIAFYGYVMKNGENSSEETKPVNTMPEPEEKPHESDQVKERE